MDHFSLPDDHPQDFHVERDVAAFKGQMVRSRFDKKWNPIHFKMVRLHEFESDKRFIVRKGDARSMIDPAQYTDAFEVCRKVKLLHDEMAAKYDIFAPVHFVVASDTEGQRTFYILTEKVQSLDYDQLDMNEKRRASLGMQRIFENLIEYYGSRIGSDEEYLPDLPGLEQYVYGSLNGMEHRWYLVDTDPMYSNDQEKLMETLAESFHDEELDDLEEKFSIDLSSVREKASILRDKLERLLDAAPAA